MMAAPDWAASGRTDTFSAVLVDPFTLAEVADVAIDPASTSVEWDCDGDVVASASIKLLDGQDYRIGGKSYMVRLKDAIALPDGTSYALTLGTFFCMYSQGTSLNGRNDRTLSGYSCLWRQSQDLLMDDFYRAAGGNVVQAVRDLIEADGGMLAVAADVNVGSAFGNAIWFDAGTNKLAAAKTIAGWIGCEVVPDPDGRALIRPYREPLQTAPSYTFEAGETCVYRAGMSWSSNRSDLCNRVVYVYSSGDETERAVADLPPNHMMSYENVGYHKTSRVEVSERPSAGVESAAWTELYASSVEETPIVIDALLVPGLGVGDVVRYVNPTDWERPLDVVAQVAQVSVKALVPGLMAEYKLKIVRW